MKKFFMLALAAVSMSLVSCSSETTEEIQNEPQTRVPSIVSYITFDNNDQIVCTQRNDMCSLLVNQEATLENVRENDGFFHYHCEQPGCNSTNQAFMDENALLMHFERVHGIFPHSGGEGASFQ